MSEALFLLFVAAMTALVVALIWRALGRRGAIAATAALAAWLAYVAVASRAGLFADAARRPPGALFLLAPVALFVAIFAIRGRLPPGRIAIAWLIGVQAFRVIVELFLHELYREGLVPRMLTFGGANVDIYIGATAPIAAWLATRGRRGERAALAWNVVGLLALANVVARAVLTTPGPLNLIHAEVPNRMIGTFPYAFVPALFVPLAVALHVLAIRSLARRGP